MFSQKGFIPVLLIILAALGIIVYLLISSTFPFKNKLFSLFYPKPSSYAGQFPQPAHLGWRLSLVYQKSTGNLVLKKKVLTGVLPQPPRQPRSDDQYLNFKIISKEKNYQNWVVLKKSFVEDQGAEFEFTIDIPFEKGKVEIEKETEVIVTTNLE